MPSEDRSHPLNSWVLDVGRSSDILYGLSHPPDRTTLAGRVPEFGGREEIVFNIWKSRERV